MNGRRSREIRRAAWSLVRTQAPRSTVSQVVRAERLWRRTARRMRRDYTRGRV